MGRRTVLGWPIWIGAVVQDLARQHRFWSDLLELPEASSGPDFVHLDAGQGRSFELIERSDQEEYDQPRFQVAFAVEDIERAQEELIRWRVEQIGEIVQGSDSSWAYFRDPEGNVFAIKQRLTGEPGGDASAEEPSDAEQGLLGWPTWSWRLISWDSDGSGVASSACRRPQRGPTSSTSTWAEGAASS